MSYEIHGHKVGTESAAADLTTKQFYAVQFSATGIALAGAGEQVDGILQNKPNTGEIGEVVTDGVSKAVAGDAVLKGALVTPDADGKIVTAASTDFILGTALEAAGADGNVIAILMTRPGVLA